MGNFSKTPKIELATALNQGYVSVRFQQGKPMLDRELNLAADLASPARLAAGYIGSGVAAGTDGFHIANLNVATNDFTITAGRALVNGIEAVQAADTTYRTQPITASVAALPAGTSNVYLHVTTREVNAAEDPALLNAADVTFETSLRDKAEWEVLVSAAPIAAPDHLLLAVINTAPPSVTDGRRLKLSVASMRDELDAAAGSAPDIATRLGASLTAAGAITSNAVATPQLADNAVTTPKLQSHASDDAQRAVTRQHIKNGAASLAQLAATVVADVQVSVPATGGGGLGELTVNLMRFDGPAFLVISVHCIGPRTAPVATPVTAQITWTHLVTLAKSAGSTAYAQTHQVNLQNPSAFPVTVAVKAYSIAES